MNYKGILMLLVVSLLFMGSVCAQNVTDFKVDQTYGNSHGSSDYSLYLNGKQDAGVIVFRDLANDIDDDDAYDDLIHDDGIDYLTPDDDFKMDKNSDNTVTFTDYDHAQHGVSEVIKSNGQTFVVVFWAKDTSGINSNDLMSQLNQFNANNGVSASAF